MRLTYPIAITSILIFLFSSAQARAHEIESQTTSGTGYLSEGLSYSGESKSEKGSGWWNWNLGYDYSVINVGSSTLSNGKSTGSDHTSAFSGGFGFSNQWEAGLDVSYSKTKEENLTSFGPAVKLGYTFHLSSHKDKKATKTPNKKADTGKYTDEDTDEDTDEGTDEGTDDFVPTLRFSVTGKSIGYTQTFAGASVRRNQGKPAKPTSGSQSIRQTEINFSTTLAAFSWVNLRLAYTRYSYNRNVPNYLALLDDPRALKNGAANFGSTLSGFSSHDIETTLSFHLPLDLDFDVTGSQSTSAADSSKTLTLGSTLTKTWGESWKTGVGYQQNRSTTDLQKLYSFTLSYEF
jgi:hypothetical protein